ncbi:MAG: TetR family transcriptional regulator [bacterium]|nr:TetR family transcriptional regulator [bacterium]
MFNRKTTQTKNTKKSTYPYKLHQFIERLNYNKEPEIQSPASKIRETAFVLFANKGFHNTTIRDIATAADVNPAMIHYYYRNKINLYQSIMKWQIHHGFQKIFQSLLIAKNEYELLQSLPEKILLNLHENRTWIRFMRREIADGGENLNKVFTELGENGPAGMIHLLQELFVHLGLIKPSKTKDRTLVTIFLSQIFSILFLQPYLDTISQTDGNQKHILLQRCKTLKEILFQNALTLTNKKRINQ